MSRSGVEQKPQWSLVPSPVRREIEEMLGGKVLRAMRVWGGYTPSPTFRIRLSDGRRAFVKAVRMFANDFGREPLVREERVYREAGEFISPWAPAFYGALRCEGWHVLLLEDLGPKSAPPWTIPLLRAVSHAYREFHCATLGVDLPEWLPSPQQQFMTDARQWVWAEESDRRRSVAGLAGEQAEDALRWLDAAVPVLARASRSIADVASPYSLLHRDTRSDNLRWLGGRLRLFDWPWAGVGPPEYDAVEFAQSVTVDGGPEPEQVLAWYGERAPVRPEAMDASVACLAGYFADGAWRPDIPGMPRLRSFQRRQLVVTLGWAARRLRLPEPVWLQSLAQ